MDTLIQFLDSQANADQQERKEEPKCYPYDKEYVEAAIKSNGGSLKQTASHLGIAVYNLDFLIKKHKAKYVPASEIRKQQVLKLYTNGISKKEIAKTLNITTTHVRGILRGARDK